MHFICIQILANITHTAQCEINLHNTHTHVAGVSSVQCDVITKMKYTWCITGVGNSHTCIKMRWMISDTHLEDGVNIVINITNN